MVAYVTVNSPVSGDELRQHVALSLPAYMVPSSVCVLEAMPLTSNGKIDRAALPDPEGDAGTEPGEPATVPSDDIESLLVRTWEHVLGLSRVGIHDNFFDLGGHSSRWSK